MSAVIECCRKSKALSKELRDEAWWVVAEGLLDKVTLGQARDGGEGERPGPQGKNVCGGGARTGETEAGSVLGQGWGAAAEWGCRVRPASWSITESAL